MSSEDYVCKPDPKHIGYWICSEQHEGEHHPSSGRALRFVDAVTGMPCPTAYNRLCTIMDPDHRHVSSAFFSPPPFTADYEAQAAEIQAMAKAEEHWRKAALQTEAEIHDILAKALGYPLYGPGEPGYTEGQDNYVTGDHTATTLAMEMARKYSEAKSDVLYYAADLAETKSVPEAEQVATWLRGLAEEAREERIPEILRINLSEWCTCGHSIVEHLGWPVKHACNPCGASGIGENAYPNCARFEPLSEIVDKAQGHEAILELLAWWELRREHGGVVREIRRVLQEGKA